MKLIGVICVIVWGGVNGANIFGYFPVPSISHQIVYRSLMRQLRDRGHNITIVTPNPIRESNYENYTEIDVEEKSYDIIKKWFDFSNENRAMSPEYTTYMFGEFAYAILDSQFSNSDVRNLYDSGQTFDLMFYEMLMYPATVAFAHKFKCPLIGVSSLAGMYHNHKYAGNPIVPAYHADLFFPYTDRQNLFQRFRTWLYLIFNHVWYFWYVIPQQDELIRKHFGDGFPSVYDIEKNVSVVMVNTDFVTGYPRPIMPNYIEIGGGEAIHLTKPKPLPKDLQEFLDQAPDGVIYFSLGSNVKSFALPGDKRKMFLDAFRKLKQKILWKWETDSLPGKPDNVKIAKWLPQTDILAHKNVLGFITQGGLQSVGEATNMGVPMIFIPFFADQEQNAGKMKISAGSIILDFETITTEQLVESINQLVYNSSYRAKMKEYSDLTKDTLQTPMERAVWWTEYVLRHNGAAHLRSTAVDMPLYQYLLLDVILVLMSAVVLFFFTIYLFTKLMLRICLNIKKIKTE